MAMRGEDIAKMIVEALPGAEVEMIDLAGGLRKADSSWRN